VTYPYKKDRTKAKWDEIRAQAKQRQEEDEDEQCQWDALRGQNVPDFPVSSQWLNTDPLTWQDLHGKPVILQFWGCWCGPCQNHIQELKTASKYDPYVVVGVHTPEKDLDAIRTLMEQYHAHGPVCVDIPLTSREIGFGAYSSQLKVRGVPFWVVVDPDGKIAGHTLHNSHAYKLAQNLHGHGITSVTDQRSSSPARKGRTSP
jgi:thiol-disulfide isomerase/thioredoxin